MSEKRGSEFAGERLVWERVCPVCGKDFHTWPGHEWGCKGRDTEGRTVLVCSIPCMRASEREDLKRRALEARETRFMQAWRLWRGGMGATEICRQLNMKTPSAAYTAITRAECFYWQEIQWLEQNGWDPAPENPKTA